MSESILFSANIVVPSFLLILIGRIVTIKKLFSQEEMDRIATLTFTYLISSKIFIEVSENGANAFSSLSMALYCCLAMTILTFVVWLLAERILKKKKSVGSFVQGCFRCSFTVLGLSMVESFAGSEGIARCSLMLAMVAVTTNILASIVLTHKEKNEAPKELFLKMARNIYTNPLIIASALGLVVGSLHLEFPYIISKTLKSMSDMAVPLSLLCVGSSLSLSQLKSSLRYAIMSSLIKTFVFPLLTVTAALLIGFRGFELTVITIFFTAANPSACYVMAVATGNDSELAASGIVFSTVLSIFSGMIFMSCLHMYGFL